MTLSPINQKYIQTTKTNNANTASVNVAPKVNTGQPQDSVELSTNKKQGLIDKIKANKKILIPAAIGIAALAGGVIYGIKTGKISFKGNIKERANEIIEEGNKIQQRANEIIEESNIIQQRGAELVEEAQKQYDEVLELIKKGQENGFKEFSKGSKLIKFSGDELGKTMREYEDDKLLRETYFNFFELYDSITINKNIEELKDGSKKIKEKFTFSFRRLKEYKKGVIENSDQSYKAEEIFEFYFKDGSDYLLNYGKNYVQDSNKSYNMEERFKFDYFGSGKFDDYYERYKVNEDSSESAAKAFSFDKNGKLEAFFKNYKINANYKVSWEQIYIRNEQGELVKA